MALDLNYQTETVHLRSGLEPTQPGLEPGQNSDWDSNPTWPGFKPGQNPDWHLNPHGRDSNPRGWDSNRAKTHGLPSEITHLVSGLNEAQVLDVPLQKKFSERQSDG